MNLNIDIKNLKAVKRYADALIEATEGNYDEIKENLELIYDSIFKNDELKTFFLHPVISPETKIDILKETFQDKINPKTLNFIMLLLKENRFVEFESILSVFKDRLNELNNIKKVSVTTAIEIDNSIKENIVNKLKNKLNSEILLDLNIDKDILGGIIIRLEDKIIDLSLKNKFERLRKI